MDVRSALHDASILLKKAGIDSPRLEAEILLAYALKIDRAYLYAHLERRLTSRQRRKFKQVIAQREKRYPIQYILGKTQFYSLPFYVSKDVLIPRPETELLVDVALKLLTLNPQPSTLADIGTGSGCIAISIAANCKNATIYATDISRKAITVAKKNAKLNKVSNRIKFKVGNMLEQIPQVDIIISNPPYVADNDFGLLQPELRYEPKIALLSGKNGIEFYEAIMKTAKEHLAKGGSLLLEMGINQHKLLKSIATSEGYHIENIHKDLSGIERVIELRME